MGGLHAAGSGIQYVSNLGSRARREGTKIRDRGPVSWRAASPAASRRSSRPVPGHLSPWPSQQQPSARCPRPGHPKSLRSPPDQTVCRPRVAPTPGRSSTARGSQAVAPDTASRPGIPVTLKRRSSALRLPTAAANEREPAGRPAVISSTATIAALVLGSAVITQRVSRSTGIHSPPDAHRHRSHRVGPLCRDQWAAQGGVDHCGHSDDVLVVDDETRPDRPAALGKAVPGRRPRKASAAIAVRYTLTADVKVRDWPVTFPACDGSMSSSPGCVPPPAWKRNTAPRVPASF